MQHVEVPRLGVELELQLLVYTTATAAWDPSRICDLCYSSWQCQILNPLSTAWDWTCVLMYHSQVHYHWATIGTPIIIFFNVEYTKKKRTNNKIKQYFYCSNKSCWYKTKQCVELGLKTQIMQKRTKWTKNPCYPHPNSVLLYKNYHC